MFWKYNLFNLSWAVFIVVISLFPGKEIPSVKIPFVDKVIHFGLYATLVLLTIVAFKKQFTFYSLRRNALRVAFLSSFFFGLIIEILQTSIANNRSFYYGDLIANFLGCIAGVFLFELIYEFRANNE